MSDYTQLPSGATLVPKPFTIHIPDHKLKLMNDLIRLCPIGPDVYENSGENREYGIRRSWLQSAKDVWETSFDWRKHEARINSYPNFLVTVPPVEDGNEIDIHFLGLFSRRKDAVPLVFYHGWPGSFLEFLDIVDLFRKRYTADDLPYHVIVPSSPGFAFSSGPPLDEDFDLMKAALCMDRMMVGLGLSGYVAQGGDQGSVVARLQALTCEGCRAFHVNALLMSPPSNIAELELDDVEKNVLPHGDEFRRTGMAYAMEHGTKPATIGLALQSSPVALLCWIGEKFLSWSDEDPKLERILECVSLYWLTDTFPRCMYPYRSLVQGPTQELPYIAKPFGYSFFAQELIPVPVSWAGTVANLVHYKRHERGGHFAALEKPQELLDDVEGFIAELGNMN